MKKIVLFFISIGLILSLAACGFFPQPEEELTNTAEHQDFTLVLEEEITNTAEYQDFTLVLGEAERFIDSNSQQTLIRVHATYTNASTEPQYALSCFAVRAFQNGKEIPEVSDINGSEASLTQEVMNGQTIDVTYVFVLEGESAVEVLVGEPTAEQTTIGKATYPTPTAP